MDAYQHLRSIPFPSLASALGIDLKRFKRRKQDWQGYCPAHQSKTNNNCFAYHDSGKWHCFSCNAKGSGAIDLTKTLRNCGFQAAVEFLQGFTPQTTQTQKSPVLGDSGSNTKESDGEPKPLDKDSWSKFKVPCPWLEARIPDAGVRERYGVFCYDNPSRPKSAYRGRVMLPVKDQAGQLFGYLGRSIEPSSEPKYLFPKNLPKSRFLFGAYELWEARPHRIVYLVESPFCVMKFASLGLPAVSSYGWTVSEAQVSILRQICKGLVYLPDRNKQGTDLQQYAHTLAEHLWLRIPGLPDGIDDPEHLTLEQIQALTR